MSFACDYSVAESQRSKWKAAVNTLNFSSVGRTVAINFSFVKQENWYALQQETDKRKTWVLPNVFGKDKIAGSVYGC